MLRFGFPAVCVCFYFLRPAACRLRPALLFLARLLLPAFLLPALLLRHLAAGLAGFRQSNRDRLFLARYLLPRAALERSFLALMHRALNFLSSLLAILRHSSSSSAVLLSAYRFPPSALPTVFTRTPSLHRKCM